jgi:formate dehydrogenase iron-sulfur subunit
MKLSRRDFLKLCGAGAAMLGMGATMAPPAMGNRSRAVPIAKNVGGILIDTTRCVGCKSCQVACKVANGLPTDDRPVALSPTTLTIVDFRNISTKVDQPEIKPVKRQCMHCQDAACVSVCPVGALYKTEKGFVAYDADKCIGCRYCMVACPFGVPKYDWNSPNPKINKCALGCMANGQRNTPACVQACPQKALYYGDRQELLTIARSQIANNPGKYINHIYGANELGGTGVMYLANASFDQLGFRTDLPNEPLPNLTWAAQEKIPAVLASVFALLSGIAWWTHRAEAKKMVEVPVETQHD